MKYILLPLLTLFFVACAPKDRIHYIEKHPNKYDNMKRQQHDAQQALDQLDREMKEQ